MSVIRDILGNLLELVPTAVAVAVVVLILFALQTILSRRGRTGNRFGLRIIMLLASLAGLLVVILALPVSEATTGQLLSLIGILLSAAIAFSSTTFLRNVLAGIMLRAVRNFRPGDFIRIDDHFGRVSEQGLFHVEIQTEDSDLTTLPNSFVATRPVKVIRASGTLVTAEVSIGYDVPHEQVEEGLLAAAADAGLEEPFVHIVDLGNASITYRVAGLLTDLKRLLTTRSRLRGAMLDRLHASAIEIVSPTFMNQRQLDPTQRFIPHVAAADRVPEEAVTPEAVIFDKADEAQTIEQLKEQLDQLSQELKRRKQEQGKSGDRAAAERSAAEIELLEQRRKSLEAYAKQRAAEADNRA